MRIMLNTRIQSARQKGKCAALKVLQKLMRVRLRVYLLKPTAMCEEQFQIWVSIKNTSKNHSRYTNSRFKRKSKS